MAAIRRQNMTRLGRNADVLSYLLRIQPKTRKLLLKDAPKDLVDTLCECVLNVLNGNVRVSDAQRRQLARYKKDLRTLVDRRPKLVEKKRVLQRGGFFPILAKVLVPVLGQMLGGLLGGRQ
jgi:hypothetical protein